MSKFHYLGRENTAATPKAPGVYALNTDRQILYIGKAANLRERIKNHFQKTSWRDSLFIDQVTRVGYIETNSEIEALLLESKLIKQHKPKYNVMWKDDKGYFFVAITGEELPRIFITHQPVFKARSAKSRKGTWSHRDFTSETRNKSKIQNSKVSDFGFRISDFDYIGPFVDGKALKRTLRMLRRVFPYYTVRKHSARPCPYCHLGLCPGPAPDKREYQKNIKNLIAVLEGKKPAVLKKLQREMKKAAQNQAYEKAGKLRDQIRDLEIIFSHAKVLRPAEEKTPLNWTETESYLKRMFHARKRISRVEAYDISNIQGKEATGSMPVFMNGKPAKEHYKKFKVRISGKANDFAMLEEVLTRRLAHEEWDSPDLIIIDGGKGQLTAALRALRKSQTLMTDDQAKSKSQISKIHVAAIAKRNNELFLPGRSEPLLLKDMPQPVSNLILHIRDEAHRFAVTYHRKLRRIDLLGKKR